jgi:ABC-type multidrug transport system ATPase subunit
MRTIPVKLNNHFNLINSEEKETDIESDSSVYYSLSESDSKTFDAKNVLSIAWINMTLKVEKTFYSDEKIILKGINGFAEFGTITGLMGPSGSGKTSLLKCLNGMYRHMINKKSKIYLSKTKNIRTCFIAQDQREHILSGLTVEQTLLYATKLKNSAIILDHELNIKSLMEELRITDIKTMRIEKCSSGQQKRIVMAMELTAKVKPNLFCIDEPTSGVDSYSALLVCFCYTFYIYIYILLKYIFSFIR